mmetsp:Transcript_3987/g.5144  ORF Transcript_3987/g.5144 Transcript_3987/m.5144 type:complete len:85 (-) Transcript_3987:251-505(-)
MKTFSSFLCILISTSLMIKTAYGSSDCPICDGDDDRRAVCLGHSDGSKQFHCMELALVQSYDWDGYPYECAPDEYSCGGDSSED